MSKDELRGEFAKKPERFYATKTFEDEGFIRKKCTECGKNFWTVDSQRTLCGDSSHEAYSFIKDKPREIGYEEFWYKFADFFEKNGHTAIDKYPVVSRWRQDLYFTIASIQDFQRIENGKMSFEYSANPLVVPQICVRFPDIPNVGVTGRHYTAFMMAGQHAFNYPDEGYWRDRTIELNYKYLTTVLGVDKESLTYVEDVWAMGDFSEFGPSLEFFSKGLELGNNVFTEFESINGNVQELKSKVVDVGWGLDAREIWYYAGTQTAYDAAFKNEMEYINGHSPVKPDRQLYAKIAGVAGKVDFADVAHGSETEKKLIRSAGVSEAEYYDIIKPMQAAYAIADHSRCLLFTISDGALPSNIGGGYNLRILLRRMLDFMARYHIDIDIIKLMEIEARDVSRLYKGLDENLDEISNVIDIERRRYEATRASAVKTVTTLMDKGENLTVERMRTLYESNGVTPELVSTIAASKGMKIELSEEAYGKIIKGDFVEGKERKKEAKVDMDVSGLPKTMKLFYTSKTEDIEADASVLRIRGNMAVLDRTPFYAESGGQEADHGSIGNAKVTDVQSVNGVIVHMLDGKLDFGEGAKVHCSVDQERRIRLMAHHTATHLMSAAARKVLGPHAWQEGARKSADKAHIDIAHYERLSEAQVQKLEDTANSYVVHGMKVKIEYLPRSEAESKFSFSIYQGHGVPSSELRMVEIYDLDGKLLDAEACGGLHLEGRESMIGLIKIIASSRIHDGINRLEYVAGPAAVDYMKRLDGSIRSLASVAGVDQDKLAQSITSQIKELKDYKKEHERLAKKLADFISEGLLDKGDRITENLDYDRRMLREIATKVADSRKGVVVMLYNGSGYVVCVSSDDKTGALDFIKGNAKNVFGDAQFMGGGSARIAEGRISPGE